MEHPYFGYIARVPGPEVKRFIEHQVPVTLRKLLLAQWTMATKDRVSSIVKCEAIGMHVTMLTRTEVPTARAVIAVFRPNGTPLSSIQFRNERASCLEHGADVCEEIASRWGAVRDRMRLLADN